ncbi:hypothetical protein BRC86_13565 [Halobacteriales archaeon QS_3_64_16]|nr:MAG: hypothetical protein BRC86_13565 [Halobacteriales archaeon QS_3_64_16]
MHGLLTGRPGDREAGPGTGLVLRRGEICDAPDRRVVPPDDAAVAGNPQYCLPVAPIVALAARVRSAIDPPKRVRIAGWPVVEQHFPFLSAGEDDPPIASHVRSLTARDGISQRDIDRRIDLDPLGFELGVNVGFGFRFLGFGIDVAVGPGVGLGFGDRGSGLGVGLGFCVTVAGFGLAARLGIGSIGSKRVGVCGGRCRFRIPGRLVGRRRVRVRVGLGGRRFGTRRLGVGDGIDVLVQVEVDRREGIHSDRDG